MEKEKTVEQQSNQMNEDQIVYISIGVIIVIAIASIVVYGLGFAQNRQAISYQNKIEEVKAEVSQFGDTEAQAIALGVQEEKINFLYQGQEKWSELVNLIGSSCLKGVRYNLVAIDDDQSQITFTGQANSFLSINKQALALEASDQLEQVEIITASTDEDNRISFDFRAKLTN